MEVRTFAAAETLDQKAAHGGLHPVARLQLLGKVVLRAEGLPFVELVRLSVSLN